MRDKRFSSGWKVGSCVCQVGKSLNAPVTPPCAIRGGIGASDNAEGSPIITGMYLVAERLID